MNLCYIFLNRLILVFYVSHYIHLGSAVKIFLKEYTEFHWFLKVLIDFEGSLKTFKRFLESLKYYFEIVPRASSVTNGDVQHFANWNYGSCPC